MEKQELSYSERRDIFECEKDILYDLVKAIKLCIKFKATNIFYFYVTILKAIVQSLLISKCIDESADNTVYYYVLMITCDYDDGKYLAACRYLNQLKRFIHSTNFGNDDGC